MDNRVIFLDVDGVLNSRQDFGRKGPMPLNDEACKLFQSVIDATGAKVVLSSTWRLADNYVAKLKRRGVLKDAHGDWRTKQLPVGSDENGIITDYPRRGEEIAEWLSRHPEVTSFAIVDDDSDMLPEQLCRFVQTTFETGFKGAHAEALLALFVGAA